MGSTSRRFESDLGPATVRKFDMTVVHGRHDALHRAALGLPRARFAARGPEPVPQVTRAFVPEISMTIPRLLGFA